MNLLPGGVLRSLILGLDDFPLFLFQLLIACYMLLILRGFRCIAIIYLHL